MSHLTARRAKRRRTLLATFVSASVALGIVGASASHHQADAAPNDGADLIVMKDAAHVKMENGKPVFDANGLPMVEALSITLMFSTAFPSRLPTRTRGHEGARRTSTPSHRLTTCGCATGKASIQIRIILAS